MTLRELQITKAILNFLHTLDYAQASEVQIHAAVNVDPAINFPKPSVAELGAALKNCDAEKWILGVPARFTRTMRWNITEEGEAARLEMDK